MCLAAYHNDPEKIKELYSQKVDVNLRHPLGWAALHAACVQGNYMAVKQLLELGADPDVLDTYHFPPSQDLSMLQKAISERKRSFSSAVKSNAPTAGFTVDLLITALALCMFIWRRTNYRFVDKA